jgi:branched-chain amino acid transport system permease protein
MQIFLQQLVNGLSIGSVYALIALGYTMVYGVLRLINFAHSEVFMVGSFASYFAAQWLGFDAKQPAAFGYGRAQAAIAINSTSSARP